MTKNHNETQVTVIIPCYNSSDTIIKSIESALSQEDVTVQVIIVDDGSTEPVRKAIDKYLQDDRVRLIELPQNAGVANARNVGVREAEGRYVALLDADDWWEKDKLKKQLDVFEEKICTGVKDTPLLICTGRRLRDSSGKGTGKYIGVKQRITYRDLLKTNSISCSSVMMTKQTALEHPMNTDRSLHEDYLTWLRLLKSGGFAYGIDEPLLNYRVIKDSRSGNKLKSAAMQYRVYKRIGIGIFQRIYYMITYTINGMRKYR